MPEDICCDPGDIECNGECCPTLCCNAQCCPLADDVCLGGQCCPAGSSTLCNGTCCAAGETCCAGQCCAGCCSTVGGAAGGVATALAEVCCTDGYICCDHTGGDCCPDGTSCCGPTGCCYPAQNCCANGVCCDLACNECVNNGFLSGGTITDNPDPACIGDTITFTVRGVVDEGGIKRIDCNSKTEVPAVTPTYTWSLTLPADYPPPLPPITGSGPAASVCNGQCCAAGRVCCQGVCGLEGACCFFDTGACSVTTQHCCAAQGATYLGSDTVCLPADLCRPVCENCHNVSFAFDECAHFTTDPNEPCSTTQCIRNMIDTATCDFFLSRIGPPQCNTHELTTGTWATQELRDLVDASCASFDEGPFHLLTTLYRGCGTNCTGNEALMRCDTLGCEGILAATGSRRPARTCGCP
jgi:hypothetical protein